MWLRFRTEDLTYSRYSQVTVANQANKTVTINMRLYNLNNKEPLCAEWYFRRISTFSVDKRKNIKAQMFVINLLKLGRTLWFSSRKLSGTLSAVYPTAVANTNRREICYPIGHTRQTSCSYWLIFHWNIHSPLDNKITWELLVVSLQSLGVSKRQNYRPL